MPGIVVITACAALAKAPQPVPAALSDPGTADEPLSLAGKPGTDHGFPARSASWGRKGARAG
jgi:hypothetical protein